MSKPLRFLGDSGRRLQEFPPLVRRDAGFELWKVQNGKTPSDRKVLHGVGEGVEEIRIWGTSGTFRVIYIARRVEAVYVLHAFQKKTRKTSQGDLRLASERFQQLQRRPG